MANFFYTKDHEYLALEGDIATVGVSDYAQKQLGDVVFVELPEIGSAVAKGDDMAVVESVKAANDVYAPVTGKIVEVNSNLSKTPALVNQDPLSQGWFVKLKMSNPDELKNLLSKTQYDEYLKTL